MMNFFRKYQKLLFSVISIVTIASFAFFGMANTVADRPHIAKRVVAKVIDGSDIYEHEICAMGRFLCQGKESVIQKELLATGMAAQLAERYFEQLKADVEQRVERAKNYRPYAHPRLPILSAEEVWKRFQPQLLQHLQQLRAAPASPQAFALLCSLFLDQAAFPSDILGLS